MKRIEDLKENECIEIRNNKEAKKIQRLGNINFLLSLGDTNYPFYYYPYHSSIKDYKIEHTVYKVKHLLPKKKSLKKRVKELEKSVYKLQNKINCL